jgi:hypothetical protein
MTYELNDKVNTPKGDGIISYIDEAYIDVNVNGVDMGFEAPFDLLSPYIDVPNPKVLDIVGTGTAFPSKWDDAFACATDKVVALAKTFHTREASKSNAGKDIACSWESLPSYKKLRFVFMAGGYMPYQYLEMAEQRGLCSE